MLHDRGGKRKAENIYPFDDDFEEKVTRKA
jgi:hypothetical protein